MKSPKPANDCFRCHHVEELQTCSPGHASDTWHDEIVFWNNQIIRWLFIILKYVSIIKINNFKFSVRYQKIQHCPISSKFDMWVDNDVPTLKNFHRSPIAFSKWSPQYRKNSTLFDFKDSFWFIYGHFVCCWFAVYR
jgi:hypothetical protein